MQSKTKNWKKKRESKTNKLIQRICYIFGINRIRAVSILNHDIEKSIRLNTLKIKEKETLLKDIALNGWQLTPIYWADNCYYLTEGKRKISNSSYFVNGEIYIQNTSSFIPTIVLNPQQNETILDMCAAPGGKTSHIAQLIYNTGYIYANDKFSYRMDTLKAVCTQLGVKITEYTSLNTKKLKVYYESKRILFDKILVDAPCSAEGMINLRNPNSVRFWSEKRIEKFSTQQKQIITTAFDLLKKGGTMVYSTCTYAPEENERVLDHLLKSRKNAKLEEIQLKLDNFYPALTRWNREEYNKEIKKAVRIMPNRFMEGFFVAKIKKH